MDSYFVRNFILMVLVLWEHNQFEKTREHASGSFHVSPDDLFCGREKKKRKRLGARKGTILKSGLL